MTKRSALGESAPGEPCVIYFRARGITVVGQILHSDCRFFEGFEGQTLASRTHVIHERLYARFSCKKITEY